MIVTIKDRQKQLNKFREKGEYFKTLSTGLTSLDDIYRIVRGYPLFIGGAVHHGKSEFTLELAVSCAKLHGYKFAVYLGEAGLTEISMAEICQKYIGKPYLGQFAMSEADLIEAHQFIEHHFVFLQIDDLTVKSFYEEVDRAEKELGIKFEGTILDPFNDVKNESGNHGGTHIWLEEDLKYIRKVSEKSNRLDIVVFHIGDIKPMKDDSGQWYVRGALKTEWAGGQVVSRRAMTMLLVYVPPEWLCDENGQPYGKNKTIIYNQKAKPKGSGRLGQCVINWDWKKNRYFEEVNGMRKYMLDKPTSQVAPQMPISVEFDSVINDNPF
jgi:hypothetical protein